MKNLIARFLGGQPTVDETLTAEKLALQRENQALRMDLETCHETLAHTRQENDRLRKSQAEVVQSNVTRQLETLFEDLAAPAAQILTQTYLVEVQNKPVQATDVLTVARRMVRALENHGITFEGQVGQVVNYDSARHQALNANAVLAEGQTVMTRFVGLSYQGKIIRRAFVELQGED